jgi:hypothetical protein
MYGNASLADIVVSRQACGLRLTASKPASHTK